MRKVPSSPVAPPYFEVEEVGRTTLVTFTPGPTWDDEMIKLVGLQLSQLLQGEQRRQFVLNMRAVNVRASLLLAKLVGFYKKVNAAGGRLALCAVDSHLQQVLERTRLTRILSVHPTEEEALQTLGEGDAPAVESPLDGQLLPAPALD